LLKDPFVMRNLNDELKKTHELSRCSWGKGVSKLKKYYDVWVTEKLHHHFIDDFKLAYMPLIMNIDVNGVTNTDLAKRAGITKQGMSQIVQELEEKKYIKVRANPDDKRSSIIHLTDKGKDFVLKSRNCMKGFHTDLQKLLGKARFDMVLDAMFKVVDYHEELNRLKSIRKKQSA
jgi:DNA-binding MarR family transcriptional regulator